MNNTKGVDKLNSRTFSRHEKEMGLHLLTLPKATVNVISKTVPHESSHLYPKLAGANWTCYITTDIIRLGRVPTENKSSSYKRMIDVDFGANKQISRRHADIKYNPRKNHWELRVYGKIGVRVNHRHVTKKDRPIPLTTMAYLDIGGNEFIFILPEATDIKPSKNGPTNSDVAAAETKENSNNNINNSNSNDVNMETSLDSEQDHQLLAFINEIFEKSNEDLSTEYIFNSVLDQCSKKSIDTDQYTMDMILRILVIDTRFKVAEKSLDLPVEMADKVKWIVQLPIESRVIDDIGDMGSGGDSWSDFGYDFTDNQTNNNNNADQVKDHPTPQTAVTSSSTKSPTKSTTQLWSMNNDDESNLNSSILPNHQLYSDHSNTNNTNDNNTEGDNSNNNNNNTVQSITEPIKSSQSSHISIISSPSDTTVTTPSVISTVQPSPAERTLSTISNSTSFSGANLNTPSTTNTSSQPNTHYNNQPSTSFYSSSNAYHVTNLTSPFCIGSTYSRGISIESIYSNTMIKNETENHLKRKLSITDQKDHDIWTRFRTNFWAQS